jgi:hypothetical protein
VAELGLTRDTGLSMTADGLRASIPGLMVSGPKQRDRISSTGLFEKIVMEEAEADSAEASEPEGALELDLDLDELEPEQGGPLLASVRIDVNGEVVSQHGSVDTLAPLVAYVTRIGALLSFQLGLHAFEAVSADLGPHKALVFVEGKEMVGLLLAPGPLYQELRQQLDV